MVKTVQDFMLIKGQAGQLFIILLNFLMFAILIKIHAQRVENIFLLLLFFSLILFLEGLILYYLVSNDYLDIGMDFVLGILSAGILGIFVGFLLNKTT